MDLNSVLVEGTLTTGTKVSKKQFLFPFEEVSVECDPYYFFSDRIDNALVLIKKESSMANFIGNAFVNVKSIKVRIVGFMIFKDGIFAIHPEHIETKFMRA